MMSGVHKRSHRASVFMEEPGMHGGWPAVERLSLVAKKKKELTLLVCIMFPLGFLNGNASRQAIRKTVASKV